MDTNDRQRAMRIGCLSQVGLAAVLAIFMMLLGTFTLLVPPWAKVRGQKQQVLYWSSSVNDSDFTFAGHHPLLGGREWQRDAIRPDKVPSSGEVFDVVEYKIYWQMLLLEWLAIGLGGVALFIYLSRRLRQRSINAPEQIGLKSSPLSEPSS